METATTENSGNGKLILLHWPWQFGQNGAMKSLLLSLSAAVLGIAQASAYSDYVYIDQPLVQATFDRLIPTSYPTIQPDFNNLRPTTWPLIYPGIPQVRITDNLVHPLEQPLLIVN